MSTRQPTAERGEITGLIVVGVLLLALVFGLGWGILYGLPALGRYQAVENANNQVRINEIVIQQQAQNIHVEEQKAQIRVVEARGIAEAQQIINATLTDKYLQHEAIKAQEKMAASENHTVVYIPSGQNGIPLVTTVDAEQGR